MKQNWGRWGRAPRPFGRDLARWVAFCRSIDARIEAVRRDEGFDGRRDMVPLFDPPLPARRPHDRPVRLRLVAIPTSLRDARGRFIQRSKTA